MNKRAIVSLVLIIMSMNMYADTLKDAFKNLRGFVNYRF